MGIPGRGPQDGPGYRRLRRRGRQIVGSRRCPNGGRGRPESLGSGDGANRRNIDHEDSPARGFGACWFGALGQGAAQGLRHRGDRTGQRIEMMMENEQHGRYGKRVADLEQRKGGEGKQQEKEMRRVVGHYGTFFRGLRGLKPHQRMTTPAVAPKPNVVPWSATHPSRPGSAV